MNSVEQEIKIIENVISLLYQCLKINKETANDHAFRSCLKDIRKCERELQRLKLEQNKKKN